MRTTKKSFDPAAGLLFVAIVAAAMYYLFPLFVEAVIGIFFFGGIALAVALLLVKYAVILALFGFGLFFLNSLIFGGKKR